MFGLVKHTGGSGESAISQWYHKLGGTAELRDRAKKHIIEGANGLRQGGESLIVGGGLGVLAAQRGSLDVNVKGHNVPIDGAVGVVGIALGAAMAHEGVGADLRNAGAAALSVLAYRKGEEWWHARKGGAPATAKVVVAGKPASKVAGEGNFGEDPIVALAAHL